MATTELQVSNKIEEFSTFVAEATSMYRYYKDMFKSCTDLECDLLHKLELKLYSDRNERARLHTQLEHCLRDRRYYKDRIEELEPFVLLFESTEEDKALRVKANKSCLNAILKISMIV